MDDYLDIAGLAHVLGVNRRQVAELMLERDFPLPHFKSGTRRVWSRQAIEVWAAAHPDRPGPAKLPELLRPGAWSRRVTQILDIAVEEARSLNHNYVGPAELFLALAHPDCPGGAPRVLRSIEVNVEEARRVIVERRGDPYDAVPAAVRISRTTQLMIERANLWALRLCDEDVGSEHLLLAITDGWSQLELAKWLSDRGVAASFLRERTIELTDPTIPGVEPTILTSHTFPAEPMANAPTQPSDPPRFQLARSPAGHDPWRRRPWGSHLLRDAQGQPVLQGRSVRQYFTDRDGYPVLTTVGNPVHVQTDPEGRLVVDEAGGPVLTEFEVSDDEKLNSGIV